MKTNLGLLSFWLKRSCATNDSNQGVALEPQKSSEIFGALFGLTAALTFETPVDVYLDALFDHTAAAAYRRELAPNRTAQPCRNRVPIVDPIAVTEDVAKAENRQPRGSSYL